MVLMIALRRLARGVRNGWSDPDFRALLYGVVGLVTAGTVYYSRVEGWSAVDSAYFTIITLATVGYGDLTPTTTASRIVTVFLVVVGIGLLAAFIAKLATYSLHKRQSGQSPESG